MPNSTRKLMMIRLVLLIISSIIIYLFLLYMSTYAGALLLSYPWFGSSLGSSSAFTIWFGHLGLDTIPLIIDSIILLIMLHGINLNGLRRVLVLTTIASVLISLAASFTYIIIIHGLNPYKLNNSTIYYSTIIDLPAVLFICISIKECLRRRVLVLLAYVNALIVSYIVDAADSAAILIMLHEASTIGGVGPLDGLVVNPLLNALLLTILFNELRLGG